MSAGLFARRWGRSRKRVCTGRSLRLERLEERRLLATTLSFRQGVNGYAAAADTYLSSADDSDLGSAVAWEWDARLTGGGSTYGLVGFGELFGTAPARIPPGASILAAELQIYVHREGDAGRLHEVAIPWAESDTWTTFGPNPAFR